MMMVNSKTGKGIFVEIFTAKLVPMAACFLGEGAAGKCVYCSREFSMFSQGPFVRGAISPPNGWRHVEANS